MTSVNQGKSQEQKNSEYLEAAGKGKLETLVTLLDAGADIQCKDGYGDSALHMAADEGYDEIVKLLVDRGLDVNIRGDQDWTPLMQAARYGRETTCNILISAGADITCKDEDDNNALHMAASNGHDTIVKTLVDQGLDVNTLNTRDNRNWTPLMDAAMKGYETTFNILIAAGADITCKDWRGTNALHLAAGWGHDTIVKTLVDRGLDIDSRGHRDKTALMQAAEQARGDMVKMLLDKGARLDLKDQDGRSALQIILDKQMLGEREEIIDKFMKHLEDLYDEAREQYKIVKKIKAITPSSAGLRDCIASVNERFKWGSGKFWFSLFINLILLIHSLTFYGLNLFTDIKFSHFLLNQTRQNFSSLIDKCKPDFDVKINEVINSCQNEFDSRSPMECLNLLEKAKNLGDSCFNRGQRFEENPEA